MIIYMKKILMILFALLFLMLQVDVFAGIVYTIEWEHTIVNVEVGDPITDYLSIPKA